MKIGVKVGDVMTRDFIAVSPDTSVADCSKEMIKNKVGSLIIKENQRLEGIITEGDIIRAIAKKKDLSKIKAREVMSKNVMTVSPSEDIYDALLKMKGKMAGKSIRWLPVAVKGSVIGMLTVKDILRIEPSLFEIASKYTPIREEEEKLKMIALRKKSKGLASGNVWSKEGECEECESYGILYNVEGRMLCEECKEEEDKE